MVTATSKSEKYLTEVSGQSAVIYSDTAAKSAAGGGNLSPHELLCAGIASCVNMTARMVLEHKNVVFDSVITRVELDLSDESKTKFIIDADIIGDISEDTRRRVKEIIRKSPMIKTLSREIEFKESWNNN